MMTLQDRRQNAFNHSVEASVEQEKFFPVDGEAPTSGLVAMEEMLVSSGEATPPLPSRDRYLDFQYLERAKAR